MTTTNASERLLLPRARLAIVLRGSIGITIVMSFPTGGMSAKFRARSVPLRRLRCPAARAFCIKSVRRQNIWDRSGR